MADLTFLALAAPAALGALGGLAHALVLKLGWSEKAQYGREVVLGGIAGSVYSLTGLPDSVMTWTVGYFAVDFLESVGAAYLARTKPPA